MRIQVLVKRVIIALITIFFAITFTFTLIHMMPGDAIKQWAVELAQSRGITYQQAYEQVKLMINYDPNEPLNKQYIRYMVGILKGNLGESMVYHMPVSKIIFGALPWTLFVLSISLLLSFFIGVWLGINMAWRRKSLLDPVVSFYAVITNAIPDYIMALLLLILLAINTNIFPQRGAYSPYVQPGFNLAFILSALYYAVLPILSYTLTQLGSWALSMRGSAISVIGEDYVNAAKARGIPHNQIMHNYIQRNAILPLVTSLAISFAMMFGGSTLVENTFGYPGIGYFFGQAVSRRDYILMQGLFLLTTITVIVANFIADLLYSSLDPRIKIEE
ncbi:peptide/nickel transport system permease protein [Caldanaerobius fijiensis DSM 17918]|uniref:Peptide/nickel transport system permease protein n=1 Tax=Caldanaerobius fijiensis DSM 17918 TaxID=1121256 RepID=A0A1M4XW87_9THEO|nr:ABC transporter permease [Caldanaerobius fijiensis]SHE97690.1 peptide/nickel transport system permease protein [Caldanaerobius fijiensis DSM 17918]